MRGERQREPASARSADAGFTLVEVIVAMVLIGGAMLTVLAASTSGFAFQNMARQRQAAVGIANQVLEKIHALPYSDVQQGISFDTSGNGSDPHIAKCRKNTWRLVACSADGETAGSGEQVVRRGALASPATVLSPNHGTQTLNGIVYRWYAYVSRVSAAKPYRITTFVDWVWQGEDRSISLQTVLWVPDGCNGVGTHPVAGPCVGGLSLSGQVSGVQVNVTASGATPLSVSLGSAGVTYSSEQTTVLSGTVTLPEPAPVTRSVVVDNDPTNGIPAQSDLISATGATQQLAIGTPFTSGTATWTFDARYIYGVPNLSGSTRAGVTENSVNGDCSGWPMSPTGSPCAGTEVMGNGQQLQIRAKCNPCPTATGTVWTASGAGGSTKPLSDGSRLYLAEINPGWYVRTNLSTSGSTKTLSLSRAFSMSLGLVSERSLNANSYNGRWASTLNLGSSPQTVTAAVGASLALPSIPAPQLLTYTPKNPSLPSVCKDIYGTEVEKVTETAYSTNRVLTWAAAPTRCLTYGAYAADDTTLTAIRFHYGAMTYAAPSATAGSLAGPTLSLNFHLEYCTATVKARGATTCSSWSPLTPTFTVAVNFATMGVVGGSTAW